MAEISPVLIIGLKRVDTSQQLVQAVLAIPQGKIYVALDGPRSESDRSACDAVRALVTRFSISDQVTLLVSDHNLGSGDRVESAITEVLAKNNDLIILQDDCVPKAAVFYFCKQMLEPCRNDEPVMHISGNRFFPPEVAKTGEVSFSKYPHAWRWATWRRAWRLYSSNPDELALDRRYGPIDAMCGEERERKYRA